MIFSVDHQQSEHIPWYAMLRNISSVAKELIALHRVGPICEEAVDGPFVGEYL